MTRTQQLIGAVSESGKIAKIPGLGFLQILHAVYSFNTRAGVKASTNHRRQFSIPGLGLKIFAFNTRAGIDCSKNQQILAIPGLGL